MSTKVFLFKINQLYSISVTISNTVHSIKVKAEAEVKKKDDADAQDDDGSFRSSLSSSSLSPPVLPSYAYAVDASEAIYSSSIKMVEVPSSNSCCDTTNNPCSSGRSSNNPSLSNTIKTEEYADSTTKSSDDINVEEVAEDFYNNNTLFFAHTDVQQQQQQQQQQQAIATTSNTKALLETSNITTINSGIINVDDDDNDDETGTGILWNGDDSSHGEDTKDNREGDNFDDQTNTDFGQTNGIAKRFLQSYIKPNNMAVTFPSFHQFAPTFPEKVQFSL